MKLIIVESPTKSKTISKFLGKGYTIESSYGHIRDLPKSELGVDTKKDFQPKYVIPTKARKRVNLLKSLAKKADEIILAVDEDREGEAIAWHLAHILNLKKPKRIVFHEITKTAILNALKTPRGIDMAQVDAQKARRVLDRLVGYKLSPFLWKKVIRGLSAGRVQSVVVRLICEREKEIKDFKPEEYWSIIANLSKQKSANIFESHLMEKDSKKIDKLGVKNKKQSDQILKNLKGAEYKIIDLEKKEARKYASPPFTTSTLQQTSAGRLGLGAKRTMFLAQKLYERGLITYHRTDSFNLSVSSKSEAKKYITKNFGGKYTNPTNYKTKSKGAQQAHEAIRPTDPSKAPDKVKDKLYELIWQRFMASQMTPAVFDAVRIDISANKYTFRTNGQTLKFDGFLKVYPVKFTENQLPKLEKNEILELKELLPEQHFTQPPARYSEASLIKILEKEGIGRPSTYAPILDTIQTRNYAQKNEQKRFEPTQIGGIVNDMLVEHFPKIVDIQFTAKMEKELDEIADGKDTYVKTLKDFYMPFEQLLKDKEKQVPKKDLTEKTDKICSECGGEMIIRMGRFGKFLACSKFPNYKHTEPLKNTSLGIKCPKCSQGDITEKRTKKRKIFYGCNNWPKCDFALWDKPNGDLCPECNSLLVEKNKSEIKCSSKECSYIQKNGTANKTNKTGV